ncbi:TIGR04282 family arsenosugar biosynthesis glycosyltransferase [Lewinella sp. IMCC34191]|uniref:TIGR04282 family arsenosugar biosynthesis glycosyltransferase n=1 Tax=Lewinella sp. IMCC34191 TaxID=2259172 RepID=UPI000E242819|nr:TIGR04282 family arsenosugar biosynthesis glycosyltransferase [Lewinella sp. IMCC34191]
MQRPALIIMVKNPIAGKTKTRLAKDVGNKQALVMYDRLMEHTRKQALGLQGVTRYLHYSSFVDDEDGWPNGDFIKLVQVGEGLGERMAAAFDHAFVRGHDRIVIIGSDCPGVTTELLNQAFSALSTDELVVGPAEDGGYYLLGMRHAHPYLFTEMTWSVDTVFEETMQRAAKRGLSVATLRKFSDVDRLEDWVAYGWEVPKS